MNIIRKDVRYMIGVLGPKGTFSEVAYQKYSEHLEHNAQFYPTIKLTVKSIQHHDYAIVPLENTLEGFVQPTIDALIEEQAVIVDEIFVPVQFSCIGFAKSMDDITTIYAQFAAQGQCQMFLNQYPHIKLITTNSNSEAFEQASKGILHEAAIVPIHLYNDSYPLAIKQVTDTTENETRFVVVSKTLSIKESDAYRVSIVVYPIFDRPGLLYDILSIFKSFQISLTSIMSRPTKNKLGDYHFIIEMKLPSNEIQRAYDAIEMIKHEFSIRILGIYPAKK